MKLRSHQRTRIHAKQTSSQRLRVALNFDSKISRRIGRCIALGPIYNLNFVHRLRIHPSHLPGSWMHWVFLARNIPHASVWTMISNVRRCSARIPAQKETRPALVVHRHDLSFRRHGDFEHPDEGIFEAYFVSVRRRLHRVKAFREIGFILPVNIEMPAAQHDENRGEDCKPSMSRP
jgi:hypothetical protein